MSDLALSFVPERFTLAELQAVYEAGWGTELDPANFRRSLALDADRPYVIATGDRAPAGPRGGRRPQRFRRGPAWDDGPPLRR